jgi:hypothetical protein
MLEMNFLRSDPAPLADQNTRPGGVDLHTDGVGDPFDFDGGNPGMLVFVFDHFADLDIGMKLIDVILSFAVPQRKPAFIEPQAKAVWMCFLSHYFPFLSSK